MSCVHIIMQSDIRRMSAPYSDCIEAASATSDMDVYTQLYPVAYDHIVSIIIEFVF